MAALFLVACSSFSGSEDTPDAGPEAGADVTTVNDAGAADVAAPDSPGAVDASNDVPDTSVTCNGAPDCERVVFATSNLYSGTMVGGLTGADAICNQAAHGVNAHPRVKGRVFSAWISTDGSAVRDRLTHGMRAYLLPNGNPIASDWSSFLQQHAQAINVLEDGTSPTVNNDVWTGTGQDGTSHGPNCQGWASSTITESGTAGVIGDTQGWSDGRSDSCNVMLRLYCIEK